MLFGCAWHALSVEHQSLHHSYARAASSNLVAESRIAAGNGNLQVDLLIQIEHFLFLFGLIGCLGAAFDQIV